MYEPYDLSEPMEESGYYTKPRFQPRADFLLSSRSPKKPTGWVFISRKADIAIVLVLLLVAGLGIMWFISRLPFFLETAEAHYYWAMDMYATWGTPSMRWLFINLVVGVIVATSGLLSAFGGGGSNHGGREATDRSGYDKDLVYTTPHPPAYNVASYNGGSTRFSGPGYESPVYNPYLQPVKSGSHHESSFEEWNYGDDEHGDRHERESDRDREEERFESEPPQDESHASLAAPPPADVMSPEESVPTELPREVPMSGEMHREISIREVPRESFRGIPRDMAREMLMPSDMPPPEDISEPDFSEGSSAVSPNRQDAVEIISKVYDSGGEVDEAATEPGKMHRMQTDPSIHFPPVEEPPPESSPPKPEVLPKSHTFTIGRVIRRDQLVDFIEPLSRKLEGISRKIRLEPSRSFRAESENHSRDIPAPSPVPAPEAALPPLPESVSHSRRHSGEPGLAAATHRRRLSSESFPPIEIPIRNPQLSKQASAAGEVTRPPAPPSPLLRQRSIVYPPALLSQASIPRGDPSPPPSPPIEEAIPPPPPPHLKLPPAAQVSGPSSKTASEELPSSKFLAPPSPSPEFTPATKSSAKPSEQVSSNEEKKKVFAKPKHSRSASTSVLATSAAASVAALEDRTLLAKPRRSNVSEREIEEVKEGSSLEREDSSSAKDDDLHQQIEDFLARFHENWRLQRQESLARYKKRLVELDK